MNKADVVIGIIEKETGISIDEIRGKSRERYLILPRTVLGVFLYTYCDLNLSEVKDTLNRHHSSICHYKKQHEDNMRFWKEYNKLYSKTFSIFVDMYDNDSVKSSLLELGSIAKLISECEDVIFNLKQERENIINNQKQQIVCQMKSM